MRVLLLTGKGGVGKTTVAAATAVHAARSGHKTLLLSTDGAHSLADTLADPLRSVDEPTEVEAGLFVRQVDTRTRLERSWSEIQEYLLGVLDAAGVDAVAAEELTVLPGAEEILALQELRDHVRADLFDVVVVDCAPTAETLRLLALPEVLGWYIDRVLPIERRMMRALRPVLARRGGASLPRDRVFAAVERLHSELLDVRTVLTHPDTTVRLVLTPEAVVVAEARRTLTSLALYGYVVDGVVANRVFPADGADPWRAGWVRAQGEQLRDVEASFAPLAVSRVPYRPSEPVGLDALAELAALAYSGRDPLAAPVAEQRVSVQRDGDEYVLSLALPLANRDDLALARNGDEIVVTVGAQRRVLALPSVLRRCVVGGATLRDGWLLVRFAPDADLWRPL